MASFRTAEINAKSAVLDGEIVSLDAYGKSQFRDLLFRRGEPRFYSITHDQLHRLARSFEDAVREISDSSGSQFDPQVVGAFLTVPRSTWLHISKDIEENIYTFDQCNDSPDLHI